ncbi:MAG: hypothetical protein DHS20C11_07450 [Lysobacteraceae bacterium]|nr:MAG: hypothetical protein DHS20C11_07450 [Xanthomonadaceae bacterium]
MKHRWILFAPLIFFGLVGTWLLMYFLDPEAQGPFHDNMVPELIGFCLEGFFLVGVLSYLQQLREHDRRHELWLSLRGSLREFLSHLDVALLPADAEPQESKALEQDPKFVERLLKDLPSVELDLEAQTGLKTVAGAGLELAHDLIPVAAQLSAGHMRWWIAIVDNIGKLSRATDRFQVESSLQKMLMNLKEFDDLKI